MSGTRRRPHLGTLVAVLGALLGGCKTGDSPTSPPGHPVATAPGQGSEPSPAVGHPEPNERADRYLAEERWNAEVSARDEGTEPPPRSHEAPASPTMAEALGHDEGIRSPPRSRTPPAPPNEAEFRAWNRKDPAGDKRMYTWDKANFDRLHDYFHDLECFRARMLASAEAARAAPPGSKPAKAWPKHRRTLIIELDRWQKQLFAQEPRILENSKMIGTLLEAHEVVMHAIPRAYDDDPTAIEKTAAHWMIIQAKFDKYARTLGETPTRASDAYCTAMAKPLGSR